MTMVLRVTRLLVIGLLLSFCRQNGLSPQGVSGEGLTVHETARVSLSQPFPLARIGFLPGEGFLGWNPGSRRILIARLSGEEHTMDLPWAARLVHVAWAPSEDKVLVEVIDQSTGSLVLVDPGGTVADMLRLRVGPGVITAAAPADKDGWVILVRSPTGPPRVDRVRLDRGQVVTEWSVGTGRTPPGSQLSVGSGEILISSPRPPFSTMLLDPRSGEARSVCTIPFSKRGEDGRWRAGRWLSDSAGRTLRLLVDLTSNRRELWLCTGSREAKRVGTLDGPIAFVDSHPSDGRLLGAMGEDPMTLIVVSVDIHEP